MALSTFVFRAENYDIKAFRTTSGLEYRIGRICPSLDGTIRNGTGSIQFLTPVSPDGVNTWYSGIEVMTSTKEIAFIVPMEQITGIEYHKRQ